MIDKHNSDLKSWSWNCKESVSIYNELRPHSNYMLTQNKMHLQSQIKMRTYKNTCKKRFASV
jgi:hypothetical protein